jgi:hypothetical protein
MEEGLELSVVPLSGLWRHQGMVCAGWGYENGRNAIAMFKKLCSVSGLGHRTILIASFPMNNIDRFSQTWLTL